MKTKTCSKCKQEYPATPEFFYRQKNKKGEPGLHSHCKECRSKSAKEWYHKPEVREKQLEKTKRWQENNKEHRREYRKKYREENKGYFKEKNKQRYHENKEYYQRKYKEWFQENKQHRYDYNKKRRDENIEIYREKERIRSQKWKLNLQAGIYVITCEANNKKYMGQSQILSVRISDHFSRLKNNKHVKENIQTDFNKYGEENFSYEIYEILDKNKETLEKRESEIIKEFSEKGFKLYNNIKEE